MDHRKGAAKGRAGVRIMRFVSPETVRLDLKDTVITELVEIPNETELQERVVAVKKNWIEVKKELGKGEEAAFRAAGLGRMSRSNDVNEVAIDWRAMALARVETYVVDWSAKDANGKDVKVTSAAIANLHPDDFDEIDAAIQAHIAAVADEKKARSGSRTLTAASA